jgi:hypothetical protein
MYVERGAELLHVREIAVTADLRVRPKLLPCAKEIFQRLPLSRREVVLLVTVCVRPSNEADTNGHAVPAFDVCANRPQGTPVFDPTVASDDLVVSNVDPAAFLRVPLSDLPRTNV